MLHKAWCVKSTVSICLCLFLPTLYPIILPSSLQWRDQSFPWVLARLWLSTGSELSSRPLSGPSKSFGSDSKKIQAAAPGFDNSNVLNSTVTLVSAHCLSLPCSSWSLFHANESFFFNFASSVFCFLLTQTLTAKYSRTVCWERCSSSSPQQTEFVFRYQKYSYKTVIFQEQKLNTTKLWARIMVSIR